LSNALGPSSSQQQLSGQGDKRMKDASGKMVAASGKPKPAQAMDLGNI